MTDSIKCKACGKLSPRSYGGMCQGCYNYFRHGGTVNDLPKCGRIAYDVNGKVVCHICGRAYAKLGGHIKESHDMTMDEYKKEFGICKRTKMTENNYSEKMHNYSMMYDMDKQLIESGKNTRIKSGDSSFRKNKPVRLQEILDKRDRKLNKMEVML